MEINDTILCSSHLDAERNKKKLSELGCEAKHILQIADIKEVKKAGEPREKSIMDRLEEIASEICDNYCRYPYQCKTEEELQAVCWDCPLVNKL